ncbi:beta-ketoacyl-acyl carrier protein synthase III [Plasmodium falciparum IGH-CR14]|uniref:Beta-ketoacyl-acyl carrier protein synthase III n=1 Tax=Plasmodium falciparum IGH-CR14 TaxID=580059 RepID=A0A0L1IDP2_PLAFA|nr:beta-ketoacyl-acyl carrier protein synthase III [Plasmodium falciparum IGH-CR14]
MFLYFITYLCIFHNNIYSVELIKNNKYNFINNVHNIKYRTKIRAIYGKTGGKIIGHGHSYPSTEIYNDELKKYVDTNDEWIRTRTGIKKRRILKRDENISMLQIDSATQALETSCLKPSDIDMVINASSTPQNLFGDANNISNKIGCKNSVNMDLTAACTGFIFAFVTGMYIYIYIYIIIIIIFFFPCKKHNLCT